MQRVVQEMQNASMIHFACHGQPGILYLGPTLPSGNEPDSPVDEEEDEEEEQYDDGLLYREHLHFLHLPAKPSVVLSCNYSAAGSITEDGILGLPRGFGERLHRAFERLLLALFDSLDDGREHSGHGFGRERVDHPSGRLHRSLHLSWLFGPVAIYVRVTELVEVP